MQYSTKLLCIILFSFFAFLCSAQDLDPSDFTNPNPSLVQWKDGKLNAAYSTQVGSGNRADIEQGNAANAEGNLVRAYQNGNDNIIEISQVGSNINTDVLQSGNDNTFTSTSQGTNISSLIIQNGSNNTINQTIENSTNINTQFTQNGNNNLIQQVIEGQSNMNYQLTQNGDNLRAVIIQSGN